MKTTLTIILISPLILAATLSKGPSVMAEPLKSSAVPASGLSKEDEQAVRETIAAIEKAWNDHDMKAYKNLLREDVQWINVVGMHWRGRDSVMVAHNAYHATIFKNHRLKTDTVEIRPLDSAHAIAVVTTTNDAFTTPDGQVVPERQNRQTYVLSHGSDGWKIAHAHNVAVDPVAAQFDPANAPNTNR